MGHTPCAMKLLRVCFLMAVLVTCYYHASAAVENDLGLHEATRHNAHDTDALQTATNALTELRDVEDTVDRIKNAAELGEPIGQHVKKLEDARKAQTQAE